MRDEKYICHTVPALRPITILQKTEKIYIVLSKEASRKKICRFFHVYKPCFFYKTM